MGRRILMVIYQLNKFATDAELVSHLTAALCSCLSTAIAERGQAYLVVSGGRTPIKLFDSLAQQPIDWSKVTITLADERWVVPTDTASNERLVREHLLQQRAKAAQFVPLMDSSSSPQQTAANAAQRLAKLPIFDAVILGLGEDGHTASLFPCSAELAQGLNTAEAALVVTPRTAPNTRISMSKQRLLHSQQIYFHLSGAAKADVLARALKDDDQTHMPVRAFLQQEQVPVTVFLAG